MENDAKTPDEGTAEVLLTRSQAARRVGVSVSTIRRMEGDTLDPVVLDGRHYFRAADLERMRPTTDGEVAARAFAMFEEGNSVIDAVIALQQPPSVIEPLHKDWCRFSDSLVIHVPFTWKDPRRLFKRLGYPVLTPHLVRQCLLIVGTSDENMRRLQDAIRGNPIRLD